MIRKFNETDIDSVLDIWLSASIITHNFVEPDFWQDQLDAMREHYLPNSDIFVYQKDSDVVGFYAVQGDNLVAIFVSPKVQSQGIGRLLMQHAKAGRESLTLSVYKANERGYQFYLQQGFITVSEQTDKHTGQMERIMRF